MQVMKRLLRYAALEKSTFFWALLLLTAAVAAELAGPFIGKTMIDKHILGIEQPWYETVKGTDTQEVDSEAVLYNGTYYKRADRFAPGEEKGREVRLLQVGVKFYFVNGPIAFDGQRTVSGDTLTIRRVGGEQPAAADPSAQVVPSAQAASAASGAQAASAGEQTAQYRVEALSAEQLFAFYRPETPYLIRLAGLYFALLVVSAIFTFGQRFYLLKGSNRVILRLRNAVFAQIHRLPIHYFDNLPAGKVVSRVTNDTEAIRELFVTVLSNVVTTVIYMIGIFTALFILDYRMGLLAMTLVPVLAVWIWVYRKFASQYNERIRSLLSDINGMINESIQGMPIIRIFRRQKETAAEFERMNEEHFTYQNKLLSLNSITSFNLVNVIRNFIFVGVIGYFGLTSIGGAAAISVGVLYAFVDYMNRLFQPITGMVNQLANLDTALVSGRRVFELMDEPGTDVAQGTIPRYRGDVAFRDVTFAYKEGEPVLRGISFEAKQGQTVALVGHTGSGKSSILNLLFRFYDPQQGEITIDGMPIRDIPKQQLRKHMGIVLQDPFLFTGTIASNVSLGEPSIPREKVAASLQAVGADRILQHLPQGLDEPVIEKGSTLSAGERQLISFARALAFDPAILILDEATANIDTETEAEIQQALEVVKRGRTTFIIAHRLSTIRQADQILVLHRGEIVEAGSHEALMQKQGRYYQMVQLQQGVPVATTP
ncbi:ABC transporter ATP-binding protein [Paenibacillus turpanensis]|uniref:ABC transporter ATP-binding protein n=1 Tax=Paenibacillus turpanensis TaxID=2689078 RepID=UPI001407A06B|nr:ABC transporter ATP-binding protein [Paenibacillus turpanensis]